MVKIDRSMGFFKILLFCFSFRSGSVVANPMSNTIPTVEWLALIENKYAMQINGEIDSTRLRGQLCRIDIGVVKCREYRCLTSTDFSENLPHFTSAQNKKNEMLLITRSVFHFRVNFSHSAVVVCEKIPISSGSTYYDERIADTSYMAEIIPGIIARHKVIFQIL